MVDESNDSVVDFRVRGRDGIVRDHIYCGKDNRFPLGYVNGRAIGRRFLD